MDTKIRLDVQEKAFEFLRQFFAIWAQKIEVDRRNLSMTIILPKREEVEKKSEDRSEETLISDEFDELVQDAAYEYQNKKPPSNHLQITLIDQPALTSNDLKSMMDESMRAMGDIVSPFMKSVLSGKDLPSPEKMKSLMDGLDSTQMEEAALLAQKGGLASKYPYQFKIRSGWSDITHSYPLHIFITRLTEEILPFIIDMRRMMKAYQN